VYSADAHEHLHLVCHSCGRVMERPTGVLDEVAERLRVDCGFELDATHLALSGTCQDCREGNDE
ncbi:MAG TPA: transcriptional repressor, partial [Pseudonocardiaceae bacterium]|nr:transcriptional repressor [Pseudonocardiaceae bacterium]